MKARTETRGTSEDRFVELCSSIRRQGADKLFEWLSTTDFFSAPASRGYHGSYAGGLLQHSLNVYDEFTRLLTLYPNIAEKMRDEDTPKIIALFHDLCKVNFYATEKRNRKNEHGQWESYDAYTVNEKFKYGGHGSKSVFIVQTFMKLYPEEAVAINCHMGAFGADAQLVGSAFEAYPLAWLLHVADESATYILESEG